ncbi:MAG: M81 family metallopeptidase [Rhodobacteraceae bacterium]|jgi:microcystin degradation protein MlrC|nr:M81 family metallopeptidase [Paracoccaceae bacterium]
MTRILFAGISHETHSFVDGITPLSDFTVLRDGQLLSCRGDGSMLDGFLEVAERERWEVVPAVFYRATPSGTVADAVVDAFLADLLPRAAAAARAGVDAVYLVLHGAMSAESHPDVEGEVLARLRAVPGLERLPLFGAFDLHANLSQRMIGLADALVCFRNNPHTDARETAVRAAGLLARCLGSGVVPRMVGRNAGIIWSPPATGTADAPMRTLAARARAIENGVPGILAVNVIGGYSFADVPEMGVGFCVVTEENAGAAEQAVDELCALAGEIREQGIVREHEPEDALDRILAARLDGPGIMVEPADNIGGGGPGNCTTLLKLFLRRGVDGAGAIICDAAAMATLQGRAPGTRMRLAMGGNRFDGPAEAEVELVSLSDGKFTLEDLHSHMIAAAGRFIDMGPSAVVRAGGVTILLTTHRTSPNDLGQWRSQGIEPAALKVIAVKAAVAHRQAYDRIGKASYWVRTPGPCTSDPLALPYRKVTRPIWPLD